MVRLSNIFKLLIILAGFFLVACGPTENEIAEKNRIECQNRICAGDIIPEFGSEEAVLKVNGQWLIGPREFYSSGNNWTEFEWWEHKPLSRLEPRPPAAQALAVAGKGYDISIEIFLNTRNTESEKSTRDTHSVLLHPLNYLKALAYQFLLQMFNLIVCCVGFLQTR